jgi:Cd2+/Zn2+-exporting ATPase
MPPLEEPLLVFRIEGMDCAEEIAVLRAEIGPLVGGEEHLSFDLLHRKMAIRSGPSDVTPERIVAAVKRTGMRAEHVEGAPRGRSEVPDPRKRSLVELTVVSGLSVVLGFGAHVISSGSLREAWGPEGTGLSHALPLPAIVLYAVSVLSGVWYVLPKAFFAIRSLRPDMNLLMTIAVAGAIAIGEWLEAATVSFLFALSLALESWSVGHARRAVAALMDLSPATARVIKENGAEEEVASESVAVGTAFVVRPGERIPLDGRVRRGASDVNQAPITGESLPVAKGPGQDVFAGTINGNGALEIESTKPASQTTLARIVQMVGASHDRRAPSERWVEAFARYYTPSILGFALLILAVPPLLLGAEWGPWIYRSLVLLVIGCPCALVISTPVSVVAALASAARAGVLVKGGEYLELPARLAAFAFDKTGTLTEGEPRVREVVPLGDHGEEDFLVRAVALEARSDHPIARAILAYASAQHIDVRPVEDFEIIQGKGATGRFDGKRYWVGSHRFLEELGQETPDVHARLEAMSRAGCSVLFVGNETHVCGLISVADAVRPNAREVVDRLREAGVKHFALLTGDNKETASAIAAEVGIEDVRAELLPEEKVRAVESLLENYGTVGMVGDGVNDAPALARATLGIAMGAAGSDAAIETADVALMSDDISRLPWLVHHSRRTLRIIRQNVTFSLGVKALFVALTMLGHASLWSAIAADMGASLIVIFNGLRLLRTDASRSGTPKPRVDARGIPAAHERVVEDSQH